MNKRIVGGNAEEEAVHFLKEKGYNIICRNFQCKIGEIDIVAKDNDVLCFLEVKYRKNDAYGDPAQAVDYRKQNKLIKCAQIYMLRNNINPDTECRFDVILIRSNKIELIKNAFGAM